MSEPAPRLLLVVPETPGQREAVARRLPGVPFAYRRESEPSAWGSVEAVLLGSLLREASEWDPSSCPRLRFVQRRWTGLDDLPFERFPGGVAIAGNVGGYAPFVAEHALALALGANRSLREGAEAVSVGRLRPVPDVRTLWRTTAVILGYGAIGAAIAAHLVPFEARLIAVNRTGAPVPGCAATFPADRLPEAVASAGVVFDARPLTHRTRGTIDATVLRAMPEDSTLVSVGRAATIDEAALFHHLQEHPRFRAALDVWWEEDYAQGRLGLRYPFASLPNFLGSPHVAARTPGVERYALDQALENLARFFRGEPPRHVVDRAEYGSGAA